MVKNNNSKDLSTFNACNKEKPVLKKDNVIKSFKEVEFFLCNFKKVYKGLKLYKILR